MNALHYTALVFFILFVICAAVGQITSWIGNAFDRETKVVNQAYGYRSSIYQFIASAFFIICIGIEAIAMASYFLQWVGLL